MTMHNNGHTKLCEKCGELITEIQKYLAFPDPSEEHPDGKGNAFLRVEAELADVIAAINFVIIKNKYNAEFILQRSNDKLGLFNKWDADPDAEIFFMYA